jgi:hypothetical protein
MLNFMGCVLAPRLKKEKKKKKKKRIALNLGSQFATLGANVLTFNSKLGAKQQAKKCSKLAPSFFQA